MGKEWLPVRLKPQLDYELETHKYCGYKDENLVEDNCSAMEGGSEAAARRQPAGAVTSRNNNGKY